MIGFPSILVECIKLAEFFPVGFIIPILFLFVTANSVSVWKSLVPIKKTRRLARLKGKDRGVVVLMLYPLETYKF